VIPRRDPRDVPADAPPLTRARILEPGDQSPPGSDTWIELPLDDDWIAGVRVRWESSDRAVAAELRVFPGTHDEDRRPGEWSAARRGSGAPVPAGGVPVSTIQRLRLGELMKSYSRLLGPVIGPLSGAPADLWDERQRARAAAQRPGRRPRSDIEYAEIAELYVEMWRGRASETYRAIAKLRSSEPGRGVAHETVRKWVREARLRGLLTLASQGQPGGSLTKKARELLHSR
jgi:hypothetical protein